MYTSGVIAGMQRAHDDHFLHEKQRSESVYPHIFRFVIFGRRLYVDQKRMVLPMAPLQIVFHDSLMGLISFQVVHADCLTSSITICLFLFGFSLEKNL